MNRTGWTFLRICALAGCLIQVGCQATGAPAVSADQGPSRLAGECRRAIADYTQTIEKTPDDARAYYGRGFCHALLGEQGQAVADFTRAVELKPDDADAYSNRGAAYYYQGQYDKAVSDYSKALQIRPGYALVYGNRALAYYRLKEYDKAWADVAKCLDSGGTPDPALVQYLSSASGPLQ